MFNKNLERASNPPLTTIKLIKGSRSINSKYISVIFPIPCAISPIIVSNFIFEDTPKIRARIIIKSIT